MPEPSTLDVNELRINGVRKLQAESPVSVIAKLDAEEDDISVIVGKINELVAVSALNGFSTQE